MSTEQDTNKMMDILKDVLEKGVAVSAEEKAKQDEASIKANTQKVFEKYANKKYILQFDGNTYLLKFRSVPDAEENDTVYMITIKNSSYAKTNFITCTKIDTHIFDKVIPHLEFTFDEGGILWCVKLNFGANGCVTGTTDAGKLVVGCLVDA
jgi:hypothetical protein